MVYYVMEKNVFMMVLAGVVFSVSLSTFFFPTTYIVDEQKVVIRYAFSARERNMTAFRRAVPESRGILLTPYLSPTRLENFRGFYLRYGKNNKAEVDAFIQEIIRRQIQDAGAAKNEVQSDAV